MQYYVSQASRISLQIAFTLTLLITSSCGEEQITNSQQPNADQDPQALLTMTGISGSCSGLRALNGSNEYFRYATIYDYDTCFIDPPMARARGWSNDGYFKVDFCAGPSGNIVEATNWYAQSSSYAVGRPYTANFGASSSPTWKSLATNAGCGNADGRRVYVELTGQLPPPPTSPSPTRCTLSVTSGTVNGKIPQAGGVVSFAVTSSSGATVTALSVSPSSARVSSSLNPLGMRVNANSGTSERLLAFQATVRDSRGQTGSCTIPVQQAAPPTCSIIPNGRNGFFGCTVGEKRLLTRNVNNCPGDAPYQSFLLVEQTCSGNLVVNQWVDSGNQRAVSCRDRAYLPGPEVVVQTLAPAGDPLATMWLNGFDGEVPQWLQTLLGRSMVCPHDTTPPPFVFLKDRFCEWGNKLAESCTVLVRRGMGNSGRGTATCNECQTMLNRCQDFQFRRSEIPQVCRGLR